MGAISRRTKKLRKKTKRVSLGAKVVSAVHGKTKGVRDKAAEKVYSNPALAIGVGVVATVLTAGLAAPALAAGAVALGATASTTLTAASGLVASAATGAVSQSHQKIAAKRQSKKARRKIAKKLGVSFDDVLSDGSLRKTEGVAKALLASGAIKPPPDAEGSIPRFVATPVETVSAPTPIEAPEIIETKKTPWALIVGVVATLAGIAFVVKGKSR